MLLLGTCWCNMWEAEWPTWVAFLLHCWYHAYEGCLSWKMNSTLKPAAVNCCCDMKPCCMLLQAIACCFNHCCCTKLLLLQHSSWDLELCQLRDLNVSHGNFRSVIVICIDCQELWSATTRAVTAAGIEQCCSCLGMHHSLHVAPQFYCHDGLWELACKPA